MSLADQHSAFANGVTNEEVDAAFQHHFGALVERSKAAWELAGPPPWESYVLHVQSSFGAGFGAGYRRAHIDCSFAKE